MIKGFKTRFFLYAFIWISYISFMANYAPLGIDWLPWHESRIFNFVEYLKLNPYLQTYGFSIWSECNDCNSLFLYQPDQIYLSKHSLPFFHFIILNSIFGQDALIFFGPMIDKLVIFVTAVTCSEFFIKTQKSLNNLSVYFISITSFSFFAINPWTYKMLLGAWTEIYFLMFFLLGTFAIENKKIFLGLFLFFISGLFNYQWSLILGSFFVMLILLTQISNQKENSYLEFLKIKAGYKNIYKVSLSFLFPVLIFIVLRFAASSTVGSGSGSDLFLRIGISGDDTHNGGLLGSIQFLAGNRISQCVNGPILSSLSEDLNTKILMFNCILSLSGMLLISIVSILGFIFFVKHNSKAHLLLPLAFALLATIMFLQQSSSVHLMGYSYIFSALFSIGLSSIFYFAANSNQHEILKITLLTPVFVGILILCIHVSMLTGING